MSVPGWVPSGEVVALGWTLLHFCWQSMIILLLYALLDRCLFRVTTTIRYAVAMAMLGLMPLAALATFLQQDPFVNHSGQREKHILALPVESLHATVTKEVSFATLTVAQSEHWIAGQADRLMPWIDATWLAGVCLLALRAVGGWSRLRSLRRRGQRLAIPEGVQQSFARIVSRFRLTKPVALLLSRDVISPMAIGIWRTTVMLPLSVATSLPAAQLEAVLAHELAHIRRWDYLCNLLQTAIECLFFFHPAVWWLSRRIRELREVCCDEVAAGTCADPGIYAEALLHMEEQRAEHLQLAVALHGRGGTLLNRIRRVMGEGTMEYGAMSMVRVAVAGFVVAGLVMAPQVGKTLTAEPATQRSAPVGITSPALPDAPAIAAHTSRHDRANVEISQAEPAPAPAPPAAPVAAVAPEAIPSPAPDPAPRGEEVQEEGSTGGRYYLQKMRDAGYPLDLNNDLDTIISLRSMGVTPEYAKAMAATGFGTPTTHDLVAMKAQGVTPEYVAQMKAGGLVPTDLHELIALRSMGVTPEYAKAMAATGFGTATTHDLVAMKAQGITPEYVAEMKAGGLTPANLHELISLKSVGVTPEYARGMAATGFQGISTHELVALKAQGVTPEYVHWIRATFPSADLQQLRKAAVFHIDQEFINKARAHSFNSNDLDKLVKLKMTGLLD